MIEVYHPSLLCFVVAPSVSGKSILPNIMDSEGTEADTLSTAIGSEYGHWSDTLRKTFDHTDLSFKIIEFE